VAEATAGEFRVNFYHVRCPELMGVNIGSTSAEIRRVFEWAAAHRPIVVFLDEIDSIGSRKQPMGSGIDAGGAGREFNTVTTQLMQSIDRYRNIEGLLLVAATNHLDGLEPTLIREGRFDVKLRLDLPSEEDRRSILAAQLAKVQWQKHDLSPIARRTPGWSPARLKSLVDRATLLANGKPVEEGHLIEALESSGGQDRPPVEPVTWDDVVLADRVTEDLKTLIRLMEPGAAERLSLPAPTGLILLGSPGTGKTLTARLIASQSHRSFYSISPSEVLSGAVGGSVKRLSEIFARAKEHAPSILFFDEMDGLFPSVQGPVGQHDVQLVEQALIEISALKQEHNVFLIGTTNYLERIDPRILRGGRFSEKIEIGVPDEAGYRKLLERYMGTARLAGGFSSDLIIGRVRGMSPADLEAIVNTMKRAAMRRMSDTSTHLPPLVLEDLDEALDRIQPRF
jgi:transitional endoplasmic reticulum ATPase